MIEVGVGMVYAAVGFVVFRLLELEAKKRGTLEQGVA